MKNLKKQVEFKMFDKYRVTHHIGSELIEIEILEYKKSFFGTTKNYKWKQIYLGFPSPIQKSLDLYNASKREQGLYVEE